MKQLALLVIFALIGTALLKGVNPMRKFRPMNIFQNQKSSSAANIDYEVKYFEQQIDHFNYYPTDPGTFQMRYVYSGKKY
jgi:hypothetical protein